jgi:hypothetical protein
LIEMIAGPASILPGSVGDFLFRITNASADSRVFSLATSTTSGVMLIFPVGTEVAVAAGSSAEFMVRALVPTGAVVGSALPQILFATSVSPTPIQLSTYFTVTVGEVPPVSTPTPYALGVLLDVIAMPPPILPGAVGILRFRLTNNGADSRTFSLAMSGTGGVTLAFPTGSQVVAPAGGSVEFTAQALVPAGARPGRTFIQTLYAFSPSPTSLQLSNFFTIVVGGPPPYVLQLPVVQNRSGGTPEATPTRAPFPTPTAYVTITPASANVKINDVVCRDPAYPADSEFIELRNDGAGSANLAGWSIINTSRGNVSYTFPAFTINGGPDVYVAVYSGIGTDRLDPGSGEFYWGSADQLWFVGDKAELRDSAGKLIDSYVVLASSCTY